MTDAVLFWTIAVIVTGFVLFALLPPLLGRGLRRENRDEAAQLLYRDQLKQIDDDLARGRTGKADADAARTEIARRLLQAVDGSQSSGAQTRRTGRARRWAAAIAVTAPLAAVAVYLSVGQPNLPDQPISSRKDIADAAQMRASAESLVSEMTIALERDPDDLRSWVLLARALVSLDQLDDAASAYSRAVALAPGQADLTAAYGEVLVRQAEGQVTASAADAFQAALDQVPDDPRAQYYLALQRYQHGDLLAALVGWRALAAESQPDAPWMDAVRARIAETEQALGPESTQLAENQGRATASASVGAVTGVGELAALADDTDRAPVETDQRRDAAPAAETEQAEFDDTVSPSPEQPRDEAGPYASASDGDAMPGAPPVSGDRAAEILSLPEDEQRLRIAQMVGGLADRLENQPDDVDGWLILARSYVELDDSEAAETALENAIQYGPDRVDAQLAYARFLLQGQAPDTPVPGEAVLAFARVIEQDPTNPDALWFLGLAAAQDGDFGAARTHWQGLLDTLDPSSEVYFDVQSYITALGGGDPGPDAVESAQNPVDSANTAADEAAQ